MTYYKYRDISNLHNFIDIIMNERLYMASYKDFNDPAEGFYMANGHSADVIRWVRGEKKKELICCLSKSKSHSLLWAHYADGHKGCCIEVEVTSPIEPSEVIYVDNMPLLENAHRGEDAVKRILSYKSSIWNYEQEVRFFKEIKEAKQTRPYLKVKIHTVYLGVKMDAKQKRFITKLVNNINPNIAVVEMVNNDIYYGFENL